MHGEKNHRGGAESAPPPPNGIRVNALLALNWWYDTTQHTDLIQSALVLLNMWLEDLLEHWVGVDASVEDVVGHVCHKLQVSQLLLPARWEQSFFNPCGTSHCKTPLYNYMVTCLKD